MLSAHTEQQTKKMRTKTLLLGAAALAAGVMTSMAQNVYSVNVVGYINLTVNPGFNLVANQLDVDGVDAVGTVLNNTMVPTDDGMEVLTLHSTGYNADYYDGYGNVLPQPGWYDGVSGNASTNTVYPGHGFFIYNPTHASVALTITGTVLQGTNATPVPVGFSLLSTAVPQAITLDNTPTNNFPVADGEEYLSFTNTGSSGKFLTADYWDQYGNVLPNPPGWYDGVSGNQVFPTPAVGAGFFIFNTSGHSTNWSRYFQVQ